MVPDAAHAAAHVVAHDAAHDEQTQGDPLTTPEGG